MMSSVDDNHVQLAAGDGPNVTLTMRLLMQGKEVGSIIGRVACYSTIHEELPVRKLTMSVS